MEACFNLVDEKWIRVLKPDGRAEELSLAEALLRAQDYQALGGETPTQNVAVLRFLLAVLYAALFGDDLPRTADEAIDRWMALWEEGRFPEGKITGYLARWHERLYLFHPERPFLQITRGKDGLTMENAAEKSGLAGDKAVPGVKKGSKLNGAISESDSKDNLFNIAAGEGKYSVSVPEAARWLLYMMGYDDGGIKPYFKGDPNMNRRHELATCSPSWLGSISPIYAEGDTLFETLALNLVLLKNGEMNDEALWPRQRPTWEYEQQHIIEMDGVSMPDNPAEELTFLSRRLMLVRKDDRVLGFLRYVGEAFAKANADTEQWTLWTLPKAKKNETPVPVPRTQRLPAQMWREMGALLAGQEQSGFQPGVVRWVSMLSGLDGSPLADRLCSFHYVKAQYDVAQSSNMTEVLDDSLTFSAGLLTEAGTGWVTRLMEELKTISDAAEQIGYLAENLLAAEGGQARDNKDKRTPSANARREEAMEQFYYTLNEPFRQWLRTLDAADGSEKRDERCQALRKTAEDIALQIGRQMVKRVSPAAYSKRPRTETQKYPIPTAAEAWVRCQKKVRWILGGKAQK